MEILLLYILSTKDRYNRFKKFIKEHTLTKEINIIIKDMEAWYKVTGKDKIEWDNFRAWFLTVKHATYKADKVELFNKIFDKIEEADEPAPEDILNIVEAYIERDYATKIADHTLRIAEGEDKPLEAVSGLMEEWEREVGRIDEIEGKVVTGSFEDLIESTLMGAGYDWRLPELNLSLGPLRQGDFIIIGATPEVGKTTMLAAEASFMAPQLPDDKLVLWINNEEGGKKVRLRFVQAALGWTDKEMCADYAKTWSAYLDLMGGTDRVRVIDDPMIDVHEINMAIKKYDPGLIILDQLWKVHGFSKESGRNEVLRQGMLFNQGREWAKLHAPVVTVHQADGTATGVPYLDMSQLYMSRVAIQGEADAIVMIGSSKDTALKKTARFLNIPKNKLSGGPLSDSNERHGKFELEIDPDRARFKSFIK